MIVITIYRVFRWMDFIRGFLPFLNFSPFIHKMCITFQFIFSVCMPPNPKTFSILNCFATLICQTLFVAFYMYRRLLLWFVVMSMWLTDFCNVSLFWLNISCNYFAHWISVPIQSICLHFLAARLSFLFQNFISRLFFSSLYNSWDIVSYFPLSLHIFFFLLSCSQNLLHLDDIFNPTVSLKSAFYRILHIVCVFKGLPLVIWR